MRAGQVKISFVVAALAVAGGAASASAGQDVNRHRGGDPAMESASFPTPGTSDTFIVPAGIHAVNATAIGGKGGDAGSVLGGHGAQVTAPLTVQPLDEIQVRVGGVGIDDHVGGPRAGAFNGGGAPGAVTYNGGSIARVAGSGGGASDLRLPGGAPFLIAAGGGGAGATGNPAGSGLGGAGGDAGAAGANGASPLASERGGGGGPGTATLGGPGGLGANPSGIDGEVGDSGVLGAGGQGGDLDNAPPGPGGGGGGGLYGGGGGGSGGVDTGGSNTLSGGGGGGGGGFSLIPPGGSSSLAPHADAAFDHLHLDAPGHHDDEGAKALDQTNKRRKEVKIEFESTDPTATFLCQVDSEPETPCTSPALVTLKRGRHTLKVRSVAENGNEDVTPARTVVRIAKK